MGNPKNIIITIASLVVIYLVFSSAYIITEISQVVITQFGKPIGDPITNPGVHFKIPFVQDANVFDKRFLEWDGDRNQLPTKDKRFIWVDTYARWRIQNPLLFFQRVTNERGAQTRLDDILDSETRNAIARHELIEVVRSTNREAQADAVVTPGIESSVLAEINTGRDKIRLEIIKNAAPKLAELGIELLDLRFKRIKFIETVQKKIYERMITERKRIAEKFRSEGQGEASRILGNKERELKRIQSEAFRTAEEIKGKADAEATKIYASAYNQSADARDFYRFLKTMESYEESLSEKDWLILSTESDFFRFLSKQSGR